MPSPFLYFVDDRLSLAELSAARLDGHVVELGEAFIPADAVETAALRAGSLRDLLRGTLAATHVTAAWVHGARHEPPARHTVQRAVSRRLHAIFATRLVYRDLAVELDDLELIGGVWVTTPARTLADLVRTPDPEHLDAARELLREMPDARDAALAWFARHPGVRHRRTGIAWLRRVDSDQDDVTR